MQSDSHFCPRCKQQYKLLDQLKTNRLGAPYKTCLTCCVRSYCEPPSISTSYLLTSSYSQSRKCRRPLEEIDPNVHSLRSAPRSAYPALLPRPLPSHIPIQEPRHTADAAAGNDGHHVAAAATSQSPRPVADTDIRDMNLITPTPTPPGLAGCSIA
jgi:hypothetical protein